MLDFDHKFCSNTSKSKCGHERCHLLFIHRISISYFYQNRTVRLLSNLRLLVCEPLFAISFKHHINSKSHPIFQHLYRGWIQHDSDWSTEWSWRKVAGEFGSYNTTVAMRSCYFAPDTSDLWVFSFFCGSVYECYSLSKIEPVNLSVVFLIPDDVHPSAVKFLTVQL